jgi:hypothetical protein
VKSKATVVGAVAAAVAGDTIVVWPGSYASPSIPATKPYLTIEGYFGGYGKPDLQGVMTVLANGFRMRRARIAATVAQCMIMRGNGFLLGSDLWDDECVFDGVTGQDCLLLQGLDSDDTYSASEGKILKSLFRGGTNGIRFKNAGGASGVGPTDVLVRQNVFNQIVAEDLIDEHVTGGNNKTFYDCRAWNYHTDRNKAVYITLTNGSANRGVVGGQFAVDSAPLDSTMIAVDDGITVIDAKSSDGLVDTSAF